MRSSSPVPVFSFLPADVERKVLLCWSLGGREKGEEGSWEERRVFSDFLPAVREAKKTGRPGGRGATTINHGPVQSNRLLDYLSTKWTVVLSCHIKH